MGNPAGNSARVAGQRFAGESLNGFLPMPFSAGALREVLSQVQPK